MLTYTWMSLKRCPGIEAACRGESVAWVDVDDPGIRRDVDTERDLRALRRRQSGPASDGEAVSESDDGSVPAPDGESASSSDTDPDRA